MDTTQPFRLLDLPKDIRLMIYERIPRITKCTTLKSNVDQTMDPNQDPEPEDTITFRTRTVSMSILATCWQIHDEAQAIVLRAARHWILESCPRIVIPGHGGMSFLFIFESIFNLYEVQTRAWETLTSPQIHQDATTSHFNPTKISPDQGGEISEYMHNFRYASNWDNLHWNITESDVLTLRSFVQQAAFSLDYMKRFGLKEKPELEILVHITTDQANDLVGNLQSPEPTAPSFDSPEEHLRFALSSYHRLLRVKATNWLDEDLDQNGPCFRCVGIIHKSAEVEPGKWSVIVWSVPCGIGEDEVLFFPAQEREWLERWLE